MTTTRILANRFELLSPIGQGGMGIVYRGTDHHTGRTVAIKTLRADASDWQPTAFERFQREADLLRQLNHPNIIETIASFTADERTYIVMEFAEGGSLAGMLKQEQPLPVSTIVSIALDIADAMTRVHRLGILHRDLKPENVLLTADGSAKLTDFGIAYLTGRSGLTQDGGALGTLHYMSPEALSGETLDARADVWAFGVVLFEMLAGRPPFNADKIPRLMMSIMTERAPDLEALRPDAPIALIDLTYRMLEKDPAARLRSVRLAGAELEALLDPSARQYRDPTAATSALAGGDPRGVFTSVPTTARRDPPTNLPAQSTPFIGRTRELEDLARIIAGTRLTTVAGAGGSGKTRVVQELGAAERERFDDGVFIVSLAPLREADHIIPAIGDAVGLSFKPGIPRDAQLHGWLAERRVLLILDNFEHLLDGAPIVSNLLDASAGTTVVATSREPLGLANETIFRLGGVDSTSSVELFLQSARRAHPGFAPSDEDRAAIESIGRTVGGSPLAILLAAAWVEMLSPTEILREIRSDIDFLESDGRHVDDRHRSMRAVFDAAWQRLSTDEQDQFARLAVFRGGFIREAAQGVTRASLRTLATLVRHSLLHRDPTTGRYDVHELLRQYAERQLGALNARDDAGRKHASYFAAMLQGMEARLVVGGDTRALEAIDAELDNIRGAWETAVRLRDFGLIGQSLTSLASYYGLRTMNEEAISRFGTALALLRELPDDRRPLDLELGLEVRTSGARMNLYGYGHPDVEAGFTRALALCQRLGPSPLLAPVMFGLWAFNIIGANYAKATLLATQLLEIGATSNDPLLMIGGHHAASASSVTSGILADAVVHAKRVVELYRSELDPLIIAYFADHSASASRGWHAAALNAMGDIAGARAVEGEMRAFLERLGHGQTHAQGLMFLYLSATIRRDHDVAAELAQDLRRAGERYGLPVYALFGDAFLACATATPASLDALAQASHVVRDVFGFKAVTIHMTTLRRAELEIAGANATAARVLAEEALTWVRDRGELLFESEALRIRGDAERALGDVVSAESSYRAAVDTAHARGAKLFELRAANSLVRLLEPLSRGAEDRSRVQLLLAELPTAADCVDAREARELLGQI